MNNRTTPPVAGDMAMIIDGGTEHRQLEGHIVYVERYANVADLWLVNASPMQGNVLEIAKTYMLVATRHDHYLVKRDAMIRIQPDQDFLARERGARSTRSS